MSMYNSRLAIFDKLRVSVIFVKHCSQYVNIIDSSIWFINQAKIIRCLQVFFFNNCLTWICESCSNWMLFIAVTKARILKSKTEKLKVWKLNGRE